MPLSMRIKLLVTNINRIYVEEISQRNSSTKEKREPYKVKNNVQKFNFKIKKMKLGKNSKNEIIFFPKF